MKNKSHKLPSGVAVAVVQRKLGQGAAVVDSNIEAALEIHGTPSADPPEYFLETRSATSLAFTNKKYILLPQNAWIWNFRYKGFGDMLRKVGLAFFSTISTLNSNGIVRISHQIPSIGRPRTKVLPNVLDESFETLLKAAKQAHVEDPSKRLKIACVGSLTSYRGANTFVDACKILRGKQIAFNAKIAGPRQNSRVVSALLIESAEVEWLEVTANRLTREEVISILLHADIVVLPSEVEASPLSLLEALSIGCKVVVSDIAGHREIVQDSEEAIFWFESKDAKSLAKAIEIAISASHTCSSWQNINYRNMQRAKWCEGFIDELGALCEHTN